MFIPARAGWNGSESGSAQTFLNPLAYQQEARREALLAIATPDLRLWALLGLIIFCLRWLRIKTENSRPGHLLVEQPPAEQPPSYLKAA